MIDIITLGFVLWTAIMVTLVFIEVIQQVKK